MLRLLLSVILEHRVHRFAELANGERRSVDEHARASAGGGLAFHDQLHAIGRRLDGDAEDVERVGDARGELEDRLRAHLLAAGANHLRRSARAAQELERVDEQRLARAGLAGEDIQPRARLDRKLLHDREVAHFEVGDHATEVYGTCCATDECMRRLVTAALLLSIACGKQETKQAVKTTVHKVKDVISVPYDNKPDDVAARERERLDQQYRQLESFRMNGAPASAGAVPAEAGAPSAGPPAWFRFVTG